MMFHDVEMNVQYIYIYTLCIYTHYTNQDWKATF